MTGWRLEIHDLCLAKLAAGRPKDLRYICVLFRHKFARAEIIGSRLDEMPVTPPGRSVMQAHLEKLAGKPAPKRRKKAARSRAT